MTDQEAGGSMEIRKQEYQVIRQKNAAKSQTTCDEEFNVPDSRPDVGRMIQKKGTVQITGIHVAENMVTLTGALEFCLLYVSDDEKRCISSLSGRIPMEEQIRLDGVKDGDKIRLDWDVEDLAIHLVHPRKLNVQAMVSFSAEVEETKTLLLPVEIEDGAETSCKRQTENILGVCVSRKETIRLKEEIVLPSNKQDAEQLLWKEIQVRGLKFRCMEGEIAYSGEMYVFVLYTGEDPLNPPEWIEQIIPVSGTIDCEACETTMLPDIRIRLSQEQITVKPDANGEERILVAEATLEADLRLQCETQISLVMDVCHPARECRTVTETEILSHLLIRNEAKCRVNDQFGTGEVQGKILQICHSDAIVRVDECHRTSQGLEAEGILELRVLYIVSDDEMPFYAMEGVLPFAQVIEVPQMTEDSRYDLRVELEQLSTTMADSHEIEVRALLNCSAFVVAEKSVPLLQSIEELPLDPRTVRKLPGIVCCRFAAGDTLWDLAKTYYTTVEDIMEMNDFQGEPAEGQPVFLLKRVES